MTARLVAVLGAALLLALFTAATPPTTTADGTGVTTRVSVASAGVQANRGSSVPALSADGRLVAFASYATNLVPGDTNDQEDVFVYDRVTGQTTRVSVASDGSQGNGGSGGPALSGDGRLVAFTSNASNLVAGDTNAASDVFVYDRLTGQTSRVSVGWDGGAANGPSSFPALSGDGRLVAFVSEASNLVTGDTNGVEDVFVYDRLTGVTTRVSVGAYGWEGNGASYAPALSADGRVVAFTSRASNLAPGDTNGAQDVFVYDLTTAQTTRVSVGWDGWPGNGDSTYPALSADGRIVAFDSAASNLVPGDTNAAQDIFIRDLATGQTTRVSVASDGGQGNSWSIFAALSADGRTVAFFAQASNLVAGDTNGQEDVFVHDRATGVTSRVSTATSGTPGNGGSDGPALSADGRLVAFHSWADTLVPGDTNGWADVFVRDRCPLGVCPSVRRRRQPDYDANGRADLLWRNAATGQDGLWLMNGTANPWAALTTAVTDPAWKIVGLGDLDGNGTADLVWRNTATSQNAAWLMNGASVAGYAFLPTADPPWTLLGTGDLDGDGKADLVWRNTSTGQTVAWLMSGGSVVRYAFLPSVAAGWSLAGVGDLNFDNRADLVWRNASTGQTVAWLMNGGSVASYAFLPTVADPAWQLVGIGDVNADEMADLVWRNTATGANAVWLMDGSYVAGYIFLPTVADPNWKLVAVGDLDGDLRSDLVWRNLADGMNSAWLMGGSGVKGYLWLASVPDPNWRVVSPTSLSGALNGLLPGPTKRETPEADSAKPMWSDAPKDTRPWWTDAPKDMPPFWAAPDAGGGR